MSAKKRKLRVPLKKNRGKKSRRNQDFQQAVQNEDYDNLSAQERISGKGGLTRHRTIIADASIDSDNALAAIEVDESKCLSGRVLSIVGATQCNVMTEDGTMYLCAVRRLLRTLSQDTRSAVVAGDRVLFEPTEQGEGLIQRIEPRHGTLSRSSRRAQHIFVSNIDQAVIVVAAVSPHLKPSLIDRFIISCEKGDVTPLICINKCDLVPKEDLVQITGVYSNLGYRVFLTSAETGWGIDELKEAVIGKETVFSGQSGVGKSSLLNAIEPGLSLKTGQVSDESGKGRHTTRTAVLLPLEAGGYLVDTPGIRQLELWDVAKEEVEGYFIEFRPLVRYCKYPDCLHQNEPECAIRAAAEAGIISPIRYQSYLKILTDDES